MNAKTIDQATSVSGVAVGGDGRDSSAASAAAHSAEGHAQGVEQVARQISVCFISPLGYGLYRPESGVPFGGAELQFFLLSRELAADPRYRVSVLTSVTSEVGMEENGRVTLVKRRSRGRLSGDVLAANGSMPARLAGYVSAFLEMMKLFRTLNADVYLHAGAGVEVGAYALICRLLKRRFVFVVASSADLLEPQGKVRGPLRWLYPVGVRLAQAVVCRTREQQSWLRERYGREGILIPTAHPVEAPSGHDKSTLLWVGRLHPLKQPQRFLDLAREIPEARCVMVAMEDPNHRYVLESIRHSAAALPNVELHENVPWRRIGKFFEQAKLLVNTSTYEGFPNTFVEAAMRGTPILSWKVNPDGVLTHENIGVCAEGSFAHFLAAARELCASPERLETYGRRAATYAQERHALPRSAGELKTLVEALFR